MTTSPLFSIGRSIALVVVVGVLAGCPEAPPNLPDGGSPRDAGAGDGGSNGTDGGSADGGNAPDAGRDAGCATGGECSSGLCVGGSCTNCQEDLECGAGARCSTGVCLPGCSSASTCDAGQDCCSGRCLDLQRDPSHCGSCTQACAASEFCGRASCRPADFSQLCQLPLTTVVLDEIAEDDDAGLAMGRAIVLGCNPTTTLNLAGQRDAGVVASDGMPLALGELLVMGGGSFAQRGVRWAENTNTAQVSDRSTTTDAIYALRDGGVVSNVPMSSLGPTLDRLVLQVVRAPSGSLMLNAAGYHGPGTLAAASYFIATLLPQASTLTTRWYVVEWADDDGTPGPSAGDRYTLIASGS